MLHTTFRKAKEGITLKDNRKLKEIVREVLR